MNQTTEQTKIQSLVKLLLPSIREEVINTLKTELHVDIDIQQVAEGVILHVNTKLKGDVIRTNSVMITRHHLGVYTSGSSPRPPFGNNPYKQPRSFPPDDLIGGPWVSDPLKQGRITNLPSIKSELDEEKRSYMDLIKGILNRK